MPPFIEGLKNLLDAVATWALYLVPAIIIFTLVVGGMSLAKAEDGMETKQVKEKMVRVMMGAAIAGGGTWLGNYIWGLF